MGTCTENFIFDIASLQDLWKALECPICKEMLKAPIFVCVRNHQICESCLQASRKCPKCEEVFADIDDTDRNYFAEDIIRRLPMPCANRRSGCNEIHKGEEKDAHEKICEFRPYQCPEPQCSETLKKSHLLKHFQSKHNNCPRETEATVFDSTVHKKKWIVHMSEAFIMFEISDWGWFFYYCRESKDGSWNLWLQFLGTSKEARKFYYQFNILDKYRNQETVFSSPVESLHVSHNSIMNGNNCLVLCPKVIQRYKVNKDEFQFMVKIKTVEE